MGCLPTRIHRTRHGFHVFLKCCPLIKERLLNDPDLRVWLGDDANRAKMDMRRPEGKRFVLFDLKVRRRYLYDR